MTGLDDVEVVEESWPPYDLVNVQVGLDAFLATDGVRHELVGMRNHRHREFGLTPLSRRQLQWEIERAEEAQERGAARRGRRAPEPAIDPRQALHVVQ